MPPRVRGMSKRDDSEADDKKEMVEGSEKEPKQATARAKDEEDEDEGDDDEDEDEEPGAVASSRPARKVSSPTSERSAGRRKRAQAQAARPASNGAAPMTRVALFVVVALAVGGAAGWFGH